MLAGSLLRSTPVTSRTTYYLTMRYTVSHGLCLRDTLSSLVVWARLVPSRPGSLQAGGRSPVLLHPHEHHLKALLQGGLEIAPLQLVTLWLIVQRVGATGVAWGL